MALLSVANLVYSIGDLRILDGVNMTLDEGQHVGLVGRNGGGKSTLLKLMAGIGGMKADSGQVQLARGATAGYLTQDPSLDPERTLREEAGTAFAKLHALHAELEKLAHDMGTAEGDALDKLLKKYQQVEHDMEAAGGFAVDHQIDAMLHGLGLTDEFFGVKVKDMSGGQKGRLALAKLLLSRPDVLLLDEPTNHLDIAGREWLEQFLSSYNGAVILVSHDRWLLDNVVTKIYEIQFARLEEYPGNYQKYRELRVERRLAQQRDYEKQQEYIKKEQGFIDRYRAGQRAAQAQGREKRLERLKRDDILERPVELNELTIRLRPTTRSGDLVVSADGISKAYDGKVLFRHLTLVLQRGTKIGIIGPNGAGKSTLISCLLGTMQPDEGAVRFGASVNTGHYRQTHEHLNLSLTVVDYLRQFVTSETEQEARDLAGAFLFTGDSQDKMLGVLSGGERSRAVLAGLVVRGHNLLVLDEPTNHLDISSAERLEGVLREYAKEQSGYGDNVNGGGTLILITHDRMLLENTVNQLLVLDGKGNARHFLGTYSAYMEAQRAQAAALEAGTSKPEPKRKPESKPSSNQQKSAKPQATSGSGGGGSGGSSSKLSMEKLEARIVELESELSRIDKDLADPDIYRDGNRVKRLHDRRTTLTAQLTPLEQEWERRAQT